MNNRRLCAIACALLLVATTVVMASANRVSQSGTAYVRIGAGGLASGQTTCVEATVVESNAHSTEIRYRTSDFHMQEVRIDGELFSRISLTGEANIMDRGSPDLPAIRRSIIIPNTAEVEMSVVAGGYVDSDMAVAPSKGHVSRQLSPGDIPYEFSDTYYRDEFYPADIVELGSPYILRDFRGITVTVYPFAYNPVTKTLRQYTDVRVEVKTAGGIPENVKIRHSSSLSRYFDSVYERQFMNYGDCRYGLVDEVGRMIVISHADFMTAVQPYIEWKRQKGIPTDLYDVADAGSTADEIRGFIQTEYESEAGVTFVQIVGDVDQVPTFLIARDFCDGQATSDASYALVEGEDNYPDLFVGRFSASSVAEVETQVQRTIHYEKQISGGDWLHKGTGVGSAWGEGYGYMGMEDRELVEALRIMLLGFTYTEVDQLYEQGEPPFGIIPVPVADFINAINEGRSIVNIEGHADCEATFMIPPGTPSGDRFTTDSIYNLNNEYMLPFVFIGAPYLGNFQIDVAFPEAWLRAEHETKGAPIGAIAVYASSTDLDYASPQAAHHEFIDLLTSGGLNTVGGLMYNGACHAIDLYGTRGEKTFKSYHVFGDVSLQVRTDTPVPMTVLHESTIAGGAVYFDVIVVGLEGALCAISRQQELLGSAFTDTSGLAHLQFDTPIGPGGNADLVVTAFNKETYTAQISVGSIVCGDANSTGSVAVDDVVYIVDHIFLGGPAPDPIETGDTDCSGVIDVDDVVYLIAYIFLGGPAPCDPDGDSVPDCGA